MEQTTNPETKLRRVGRPRKAVLEGAEVPQGDTDEAVAYAQSIGHTYDTPKATIDSAAQAYAMRVWLGQSPDVAVIDRVARVVAALRGQGLSIAVELPHPDAGRYLEAH